MAVCLPSSRNSGAYLAKIAGQLHLRFLQLKWGITGRPLKLPVSFVFSSGTL